MKPERAKPSYRCIRCGKQVEADSQMDLNRAYTSHVVREHDMPSMAQPDSRTTSIVAGGDGG